MTPMCLSALTPIIRSFGRPRASEIIGTSTRISQEPTSEKSWLKNKYSSVSVGLNTVDQCSGSGEGETRRSLLLELSARCKKWIPNIPDRVRDPVTRQETRITSPGLSG